mgnify:CR=1 FL=1
MEAYLITSDFTKLGPEVVMCGLALSIIEPVIDGGDFNPEALIWHANVDSDDKKINAFAGTDISMVKPY